MGFTRRVSSRRRYQYDMRTGLKVWGEHKLEDDGERPGILTKDRDEVHPQRYLSIPPKDRRDYVSRTTHPDAIPVILKIGFLTDSTECGNDRILAPFIGLAPVISSLLGTAIVTAAPPPAPIALMSPTTASVVIV